MTVFRTCYFVIIFILTLAEERSSTTKLPNEDGDRSSQLHNPSALRWLGVCSEIVGIETPGRIGGDPDVQL